MDIAYAMMGLGMVALGFLIMTGPIVCAWLRVGPGRPLKPSFWMSNLAITVGFLYTMTSCYQAISNSNSHINPFLGFQILFGTLAYRFAKRIAIGLSEPDKINGVLEGGLLTLFLCTWVMALLTWAQDDLRKTIIEDPMWTVIPSWVAIAYVWMKCKSGTRKEAE